MTELAVILKDINFSFPEQEDTLFKGLNLDIESGSFVSIIGPSGCGKTTILRLVAELLQPSSGAIDIEVCRDFSRMPVAYMFQDARLLPWRKVLSNVIFGMEGLDIPREEQEQRAIDKLKLVGLEDFACRWPKQLSGGQKQRVAIARALSVEPVIFLMDEPFSALDAYTREELQDELLRIWQETGKTILFVTHDIREARYLSDRMITLGGAPVQIIKDEVIKEKRPRKR